jgi:hypothetical protein
MASSTPILRFPIASPGSMDISKMTYNLSTTVYLNNNRVSTEFSMRKIGDITLYAVKRKAYTDIENILEMDYDDFQFIKVEAEMA